MKLYLQGKVKNLSLSRKNIFIFALYEALANSIHSIHISELKNTEIVIDIKLDDTELKSLSITDNGEGFTKSNFEMFLEADRTLKTNYGCKGLGRFTWLSGFKNIKVTSIFKEDDKCYERIFDFNLDWEKEVPTEEHSKKEIENTLNKTTIIMYNPTNDIAGGYNDINKIKDNIVSHFLPQFIYLKNDGYKLSIKINLLNSGNIDKSVESLVIDTDKISGKFDVENFYMQDEDEKQEFTIYHVFLNSINNKKHNHEIFLCAALRKVESKKFLTFPKKEIYSIKEAKGYDTYYTLVCSPYLDDRVFLQRDGMALNLDKEEEDDNATLLKSEITYKKILEKTEEIAISYLEKNGFLEKWDNDKKFVIDSFKQDYSYLSRLLEYTSIYWNDSITSIYDKVLSVKQEKELGLKELINQLEKNLKDNGEETITSSNFINAIKDSADINSIELSSYVYYRKYALKLFEKILEYRDPNKKDYNIEGKVHNFLYPMKKDLDSVSYLEHNLWVVDDRWAFYEYITSDRPLTLFSDTNITDRPDIMLFSSNTRRDNMMDTVVIIELKRPGQLSKHKNPHKQLSEYVYDINKLCQVKSSSGRTFKLAENVRFYCYIICDTNNEYVKKEIISDYHYKKDYDSTYYIHNDKADEYPTTTYRLIDFEILLQTAKERNEAFISRLPK